jgi:hypothetical protein
MNFSMGPPVLDAKLLFLCIQWTRYLLIVLIRIVLPTASLCLAKLGLRYTYKVYHTERETKIFIELGLVAGVTTIATVVLMLMTEILRLSVFKLTGEIIISVIAYFDVQAGRIPVFFMIAALLLGFAFGLRNGRWVASILSGLSNLVLVSILYGFG